MKVTDYKTGEYIEVIQAYRNQANYKFGDFEKDGEFNDQPSLTVPDMGYTIPEIMQKFTRGVAPAIQKLGLFAENEGFNDVDKTLDPAFDLADATELLNEIEQRQEEAKARKAKSAKQVTDEGGNEVKQNESKSLG